ncbi:amidase [Rhodococcus qingshengii]|uniref:amidase n=1 Tax=Rhodococcus qingshengii TaxID=334542 RepID=UPI003655F6F2
MIDKVLPQNMSSLVEGYRTGEFTPVDSLSATLALIDAVNPSINAMAMVDVDGARSAAAKSAARWATGTPLSSLDGVPVTIKDSVNAVGMPWRHGSAAHSDVPDAESDSPPAARLKEAGAVIVGKTTMPDFGMMAAGVSSLYGIVRNPWDLSRNTGGSSAGAGASLAAGIGYAAVGTDIAGSVRLPAGHCGLVALKPTQGRIPHLPSSMMRSPGPMARTVDEVVDMYRAIARPDSRDAWSLPAQSIDESRWETEVRGLRIGVMTGMGYGYEAEPAVVAVVDAAAQVLAAAGAKVTRVTPPFESDPYAPLDRLFQVRARAEWESIPEERRAEVIAAVSEWAEPASLASATDYSRDLDAVNTAQARLQRHLEPYDFVISPVIPVVGFDADTVGLDPERPLAHCSFTAWFNQTGQPASTVCFGMVDGCPVGVQIVGSRFADIDVLAMTKWLEDRRPFDMTWPDLTLRVSGGVR